jgi:hypothetical protein
MFDLRNLQIDEMNNFRRFIVSVEKWKPDPQFEWKAISLNID